MKSNFNQIIKFREKPLLVFIFIMLILSVISKSIYSYFIPNVNVKYVQQGTIKTQVKSYSIVDTPRLKSIYADINARIKSQNIEENKIIKNGEILITYDIQEQLDKLKYEELEYEKLNVKEEVLKNSTLEIEKQKLSIKKQEEKITKIEEELKKITELFEAGAIPKKEITDKKSELDEEKIQLEIDKKELEHLITNEENKKINDDIKQKNKDKIKQIEKNQKELEIKMKKDNIQLFSALKSMYDGKIIKSYIDGKTMLSQGEKICDIIEDGNTYKAIFKLKKDEMNLFKIDDKINLKIKSMSKDKIDAIVTDILNSNEKKEITVSFKTDENVYMQNVELNYEKESKVYDMVLPSSAIKYDGKNYYINVIDKKENFLSSDYIARRVLIRIEEKGNNMVAISSEISINEKVVISSDKFIENGQKVYISNYNI